MEVDNSDIQAWALFCDSFQSNNIKKQSNVSNSVNI